MLASSMNSRLARACIVGAGSILGLAAAASAGDDLCNPGLPASVPDLDQVRAPGPGIPGLPGNGTQYCVPTCIMNIMKFLASNGYPDLDPGTGSWQNPAVYNTYTQHLADMGVLMGTSPTDGTTTGGSTGAQAWLDTRGGGGDITFTSLFRTAADAPELGDLALGLLVDQPVSVTVGWYAENPPGVLTRTGGHCVTLTRLPNFCMPGARQISFRDPGTGGGNSFVAQTTQSAAATTTRNVFPRTAIYQSIPTNGAPVVWVGPLERVANYNSGTNQGYIDGVRFFYPRFGLTPCCNLNTIDTFNPAPPGGGGVPIPLPFASPQGTPIVDLDIAPNLVHTVYIAQGSGPGADNQLFRYDPTTQTHTPLPLPGSPSSVATATNWRASYVSCTPFLCCLVEGISGVEIVHSEWESDIIALTFDPTRNRLVGVDLTAGGVHLVNPSDIQEHEFHAFAPGAWPASSCRAAVCPRTGKLVDPSVPGVRGLALNRATGQWEIAESLDDPNLPSPKGCDVDDRGHVYTSQNGAIVEFMPNGSAPGYTRLAASRFDGWQVGEFFRISRNRSNVDPNIHDAEPWATHMLPDAADDEVPDCAADFNADGEVTVPDIFAFLSAWFATGDAADFDGNNAIEVPDIFAFLSAWFAGC